MTNSCPVTYGIIVNNRKEEIKMIESRCGILCSECEYRVQMNCNGKRIEQCKKNGI